MEKIIQNELWSISSFIENKNYNFDQKKILTHLPEKFIDEAIINGASVIVCSRRCKIKDKNIIIIRTNKVRTFLSEAASKFYNL